MRRRLYLGTLFGLAICAGGALSGCNSEPITGAKEMGSLNLPLSTHGPSGTEYRLRDAVFQISSEYSYYDYDTGEGGAGSSGHSYTLSSEDDPTASSISISVERGYYYVRLLPGWRMEKVADGEATTVEATLLSEATQWTYVDAHSSSWVEYQFGIGGREVWLNGNLNVGVQVYENPDEYYGGGLAGAGTGGFTGIGGWNGEGGI